jgi:hypothetical protein
MFGCSLLAKEILIQFLDVQGFRNTHSDIMSEHQCRQLLAIDQYHLEWVAFREIDCWFCEVRGRHEDALVSLHSAQTAAEASYLWLTHTCIRAVSLGLQIDAVKPKRAGRFRLLAIMATTRIDPCINFDAHQCERAACICRATWPNARVAADATPASERAGRVGLTASETG